MEASTRIAQIDQELQRLESLRKQLLAEMQILRREETLQVLPLAESAPQSSEEKISLFLSLFVTRRSVYPRLWNNPKSGRKGYSPVCRNEWVRGICEKPRIKCSECNHQNFPQLDRSAVHDHLTGKQTIGTYAIKEDGTCCFLAADFDGEGWEADVTAYRRSAEELGFEIAVERSRSGNGGHAWLFFEQPVPAVVARRLGTLIVARASSTNAQFKLSTYDRFFPNQDTIPKGGFGNLISLPLQAEPRKSGNTVFLDPELQPLPDQWAYLAGVKKAHIADVQRLIDSMTGGQSVEDNAKEEPFSLIFDERALDIIPKAVTRGIFTGNLMVEKRAHLAISLEGVPSPLRAALKRLGTIANPVFYEKQRLRFPTFNIPRFIFCGEDHPGRLILPRGTLPEIEKLVGKAGGKLVVNDLIPNYPLIAIKFLGQLTPVQERAVNVMMEHNDGVLVAPPGAGKTVMACAAIARRGVPTLILVHRKPLMEQWSARLQQFLGLSTKDIHIIGKARYRDAPVAIGMFQTLASSEFPGLLMEKYGQVVVDECHHVPAASFEAAMKQCPARHILGLTATPTRKDGLQKILYLQCGPIRHKIGYDHANNHPRSVMFRNIPACFPADTERQPIHELWKFLIESEERNRLIASDVVSAFRQGRYPVVLSDRKEHLNRLEIMVRETLPEDAIFRMDGSIGLKQRSSLIQCLTERASSGTPFVLFATASLIGEGFDLPRLDTMVLAMPLSFKGRLTQYAGRLHRSADGKGDVRIHDYVETNHPMMMHMHRKRMVAYREMGYVVQGVDEEFSMPL